MAPQTGVLSSCCSQTLKPCFFSKRTLWEHRGPRFGIQSVPIRLGLVEDSTTTVRVCFVRCGISGAALSFGKLIKNGFSLLLGTGESEDHSVHVPDEQSDAIKSMRSSLYVYGDFLSADYQTVIVAGVHSEEPSSFSGSQEQ